MLARFAKLPPLFLALLGLCFFFSAAVDQPAHAAKHASQQSEPDDSHCDLCLSFAALDTGSVALPPAPCLHETAFAVVAALASFEYEAPFFFSLGRGPPSLSS